MTTSQKPFDVFLSYNSKDKPIVRELATGLKERGLRVWLDEWELTPGQPWQDELENIIRTAKSAAVLVGADGLGPWEHPEMRACLDQFVQRKLPVIPVLLPKAGKRPQLPLFLREFTWVDLRNGLTEKEIERLVWGITQVKPTSEPPAPNTGTRSMRAELFSSAFRLLKSRYGAIIAGTLLVLLLAIGIGSKFWPATDHPQSDDRLEGPPELTSEVIPNIMDCATLSESQTWHVDFTRLFDQERQGINDVLIAAFLSEDDRSDIESLDLSGTAVGNDALESIARLAGLRELKLSQCRAVNSGGLEHLAGMIQLEVLDLDTGDYSVDPDADTGEGHIEAGLFYLEGLTALTDLNLSFTDVGQSEDALGPLRSLVRLKTLKLEQSHLGDDDLSVLIDFRELKELNLAGTRIGDDGLQFVGKCRTLENLNLRSTEITNDGLTHLVGLTALKEIDLRRTNIDSEKIRAFEEALEAKTGRDIDVK